MSHHHRRLQRRVLRGAIVFAVLAALLITPLVVRPGLRLDVAYRLGLAPGGNATRLYPRGAAVELLILVEEVPVELTLPTKRYHAVGIAERTGDQILLRDLNRDRVIEVPLANYDRVAASTDRTALLFVDERATAARRAVLVTLPTGNVRTLPAGQTDPGLLGDWGGDIAAAPIDCSGVSPASTWVACIDRGGATGRYLAGSWELQVHPYGKLQDVRHLYRGRGLIPIAGWSEDERWIFLQNDTGIWRIAAPAP